MNQMNEKVNIAKYDNLINHPYPPADVFGVTIRQGQGTIGRGTLLARSSASKDMVVAGTEAAENETLKVNCILAEDIDTGTAGTVTGIAYRTGHFNGNALIVKEGYTVTDDDKEALRSVGILLSDAV